MVTSAPLFSYQHELDTSPESFGELRASADCLGQPAKLNQRLEEDGYLFIPGFFDRDLIMAGRVSLTERLAAEGALDPAYPAIEAMCRPDKTPIIH